jgi:hypothetical protein
MVQYSIQDTGYRANLPGNPYADKLKFVVKQLRELEAILASRGYY